MFAGLGDRGRAARRRRAHATRREREDGCTRASRAGEGRGRLACCRCRACAHVTPRPATRHFCSTDVRSTVQYKKMRGGQGPTGPTDTFWLGTSSLDHGPSEAYFGLPGAKIISESPFCAAIFIFLSFFCSSPNTSERSCRAVCCSAVAQTKVAEKEKPLPELAREDTIICSNWGRF